MSQVKDLISREIRNERRRTLRGRVVSDPRQINFDPSGIRFLTWVVDVDIGGDRILRDVPIKISERGRMYAQNGSTVFLERDAQGRYQIVAPGDRVQNQGNLIEVDEDTGAAAGAVDIGFSVVREIFDFYKGTTPESFFDPALDANTLVWLRSYDRLGGLPDNITPATDTDGAEIVRIDDKSGGGFNALTTGVAGENPLYRRFDATNFNSRSTADFDGTNDQLDFAVNIQETVPGVVSFFILLQKDATGVGDDVAIQTDDWRIFSRRAAGDTWGFENGGAVQDSGSTLSTTQTLIEIIATSFANVDLYEDGTFLGNFTPAAAGLGTGASSLGNNSATTAAHNGRIAEVLIMDETVSATKRVAIENYFNQTMNVAFSKWNNGVDGFPRIRVFDADGNEVI